jgi:hypothetical protein
MCTAVVYYYLLEHCLVPQFYMRGCHDVLYLLGKHTDIQGNTLYIHNAYVVWSFLVCAREKPGRLIVDRLNQLVGRFPFNL